MARTTFSISGESEAVLGETARAPFHKNIRLNNRFPQFALNVHRTGAQRILEAIYASPWRHKHKTQQISGNVPYSERHVITFYVCHTSWPRWPTNFFFVFMRGLWAGECADLSSAVHVPCAGRYLAFQCTTVPKLFHSYHHRAATTHYSRIDLFPLMIFLVRSLCLCVDGFPRRRLAQVCALRPCIRFTLHRFCAF